MGEKWEAHLGGGEHDWELLLTMVIRSRTHFACIAFSCERCFLQICLDKCFVALRVLSEWRLFREFQLCVD